MIPSRTKIQAKNKQGTQEHKQQTLIITKKMRKVRIRTVLYYSLLYLLQVVIVNYRTTRERTSTVFFPRYGSTQ